MHTGCANRVQGVRLVKQEGRSAETTSIPIVSGMLEVMVV